MSTHEYTHEERTARRIRFKKRAKASALAIIERLAEARRCGDAAGVKVLERSLEDKGIVEGDDDSVEEFAAEAAGRAAIASTRASIDASYTRFYKLRGDKDTSPPPRQHDTSSFTAGLLAMEKEGKTGKMSPDQAVDRDSITEAFAREAKPRVEMPRATDFEFVSTLLKGVGKDEFTNLVCQSGCTPRDAQNLLGVLQYGADRFDSKADADVVRKLGELDLR